MSDATESPNVPRRGFLERVAAASMAVGLGGALPARLRAEPAVRALDFAARSPEAWPPVQGRHKQIFDAVSVNNGFSMVFASVFLDTNNKASGIKDSDLGAVIVLRHEAIPIGFTDAVWTKYKFGELGLKDPATKQPAERNFYYHSREGDVILPGASVDALMGRGVIFGLCNVALGVLSSQRGKAIGVDAATARKDFEAGLIPGITILPSGVWGVNRAQEKGCSYCYAE